MQRRKSRVVNIGDLPMGGSHPIRVQSMTNLPTSDISGQVEQIKRIIDAGGEYVRITAPTLKDVEHISEIKRKVGELENWGIGVKQTKVPIIADVHFSPKIAIAAAKVADKVRINPGNFFKKGKKDDLLTEMHEAMLPFLNTCKEYGTAIRIGTNHGSLSERIMELYGDTPLGMVEATLEVVRICVREDFHNIVLSLKSSNVRVVTEATRLLVRKMDEEGFDYPIHLGVTEAGDGDDGRIKSAVGIGSLLVDGIGDTIRVSLTEEPENEIPVAYNILQAARARITKTDYIACPGCGRTTFNLQEGLKRVREATNHLTGLKIAVMGCIVNGPGEMADADYGYVGAGPGLVSLYKGKELVQKNIPENEAINALLKIIED